MTNAISTSEWAILRVLWTLKGSTSRQLTDVMTRQKAWDPSTTKTLLRRLVDKGLVAVEGAVRKRIYKPTVLEKDLMTTHLQQAVTDMCAMKVGDALVDVLTETTLSQKDLATLITVLQQKLTDAPDTVACDCLPADCACTGGHSHD